MRATGVERELYRYYKPETCGLDFEGMIADLEVICLALLWSTSGRSC